MEKQSELEAPSNYNYGTWIRNAISKEKKSLKVHAPNAAMPGTAIATDLVTQLTNECLVHRYDYLEVCLAMTLSTDSC